MLLTHTADGYRSAAVVGVLCHCVMAANRLCWHVTPKQEHTQVALVSFGFIKAAMARRRNTPVEEKFKTLLKGALRGFGGYILDL